MDNNNKRRKRNRKQRKKSQQDIKNCPKNEPIKEKQNAESQKTVIVTNKIASSSPRPISLMRNNCEINKRCSGSEFEDFQTPSIEYDMRNGSIDEIDCEDFNNGYEKEWNDIGSFTNDIEKENDNHGNGYSKTFTDVSFNSKKVTYICNGSIKKNDLGILKNDFIIEKDSQIVEMENNEISENKLIMVAENEIIYESEKCETIKEIETPKINDKKELDKDEVILTKSENEYSPNTNSNERDEEICEMKSKDALLIEEENDPNDNEACINCVNEFFEDLEEECYKYPIEESNNEYGVSSLMFSVSYNEVERINGNFDSDPKLNIIEFDDQELVTDQYKENRNINEDNLSLTCTEENLREEILLAECIKLDVVQPPLVQKSMTLQARPSISSFKQSITSITNVTSISDENIPLHTDNDIKKLKKNKYSTFRIYTNFMNKFRKRKSPVKEISNEEIGEQKLSLKSEDIIKDSEIESNQSLKSNFEFDNNSKPHSEEFVNDCEELGIAEENFENIKVNNESETEIKKKEGDPVNNSEVKYERQKREKYKLLNILLKKKEKKKKQNEEINVEEKIDTHNLKSFDKNDNTSPENGEIEKEVIEQFNDAVKSLQPCEEESRCTEIITSNVQSNSTFDVHTDIFIESRMISSIKDESDDHLYPDAITATKIFGFKPPDVPYIDDQHVIIADSESLYNGESKRVRIFPNFYVPMASMESLYFPGESIQNEILQKSMISHSPCRSKSVLGNFLGFISRGR